MANQVFYFGTAERMAWLPCPNTGMQANNVSWRTTGTFLNGGGYARSSSNSHLEYSMAWPVMSTDDAYSLIDYFNGVYGDGPFYFIDPMAMAFNILPGWIAEPRLQVADAPTMVPGQTPVAAPVITSSNGYPSRGARYTLTAGQSTAGFSFYIPSGYTARFGWHGTATSTATIRVTGATTVNAAPISGTGSTTRFNTTVAPGGVVGAGGTVNIALIGGASGGVLTMYGMTLALIPTAGANPTGSFVSGRGNLGVQLRDDPQITAYSSAIPNANIGVSANFIETGAWL